MTLMAKVIMTAVSLCIMVLPVAIGFLLLRQGIDVPALAYIAGSGVILFSISIVLLLSHLIKSTCNRH